MRCVLDWRRGHGSRTTGGSSVSHTCCWICHNLFDAYMYLLPVFLAMALYSGLAMWHPSIRSSSVVL
jgi:hypothetical protein